MNGGGFDRPVAPIEPEPDDVPEDVAVPPVALRPDLLRPRFPRQPDGGVDAPDDFPELSPVEQRPDPLPPGVESEAPGRLRPATVEKVLDAGPVQVLAPGEYTRIRNASKREQEELYAFLLNRKRGDLTVAEVNLLDFFGTTIDSPEEGNKVNLQDMVSEGIISLAELKKAGLDVDKLGLRSPDNLAANRDGSHVVRR